MNPFPSTSSRYHQHQQLQQEPLNGHRRHAGVGCHHRHPHSPKSQSIPIQRRGSVGGGHHYEQRMQEEEMMADYVDYCFCERLVSGMQRKVSFQIHDVTLRYENQALIDHIIMTRRSSNSHGGGLMNHECDDELSPPSTPPISPTLRPRIITAPSLGMMLGDDHDLANQRSSSSSHIEDEMIFDMEL
eukprot:CAMPEP_0113487718 /NCGR_PEP_ID=MMETSP0014_2-20120614/25649_1 /TAXON_ID=2857 /ORGANISM="Nitzschia sp." /LENGTH=186 /DNA_ID=CAMNT_0000381415 /DNA_START=322 /DNA_END=885 /DNA_ORIENTATION=- /assembly_acc=CAM_ASM_000159